MQTDPQAQPLSSLASIRSVPLSIEGHRHAFAQDGYLVFPGVVSRDRLAQFHQTMR